MGWDVPVWAHIPLIHGPDGKKLSKRHGALGVEEYQAMGYPAAAMRNYLARLGWSHGDDEFFTDEQARGLVRSGRHRQVARAVRLQETGKPVAASTSPSPTMPPWWPRSRLILPRPDLPALTATSDRRAAARHVLPQGSRARPFRNFLKKRISSWPTGRSSRTRRPRNRLDDVSRGILTELTPHLQNASWNRDTLEAGRDRVSPRPTDTKSRQAGRPAARRSRRTSRHAPASST